MRAVAPASSRAVVAPRPRRAPVAAPARRAVVVRAAGTLVVCVLSFSQLACPHPVTRLNDAIQLNQSIAACDAGGGNAWQTKGLPIKRSHAVCPPLSHSFLHSPDDDDAAFEARLAELKKAKGQMPYGESRKAPVATATAPKPAPTRITRPQSDYDGETVHFESGPHVGDAGVNVALGITLVWLPLTIAALGRAAFVKYRFTDRRLSVMTTAPWKTEQLDADYRDVVDVKTVGRGVGLWGDMLITLKSGDKVELRAVPRFLEMRKYVEGRRDALAGKA